MAELVMTRHARFAAERRGLSRGEIRAAVYHPDTVRQGHRQGIEQRIAGPADRKVVAIVAIERRHLRLLTTYVLGEVDEPAGRKD